MKTWIAEITCLDTKTLIVRATTRKEALEKLKSLERPDVEGIDVNYGPEKAIRIVCEDKRLTD